MLESVHISVNDEKAIRNIKQINSLAVELASLCGIGKKAKADSIVSEIRERSKEIITVEQRSI